MSVVRSDRRGFALLAVLWVIALLGVLAAEYHPAVQTDVRIAANARNAARARWIARGGLARALDALDRVLAADSAARVLAVRGDTLLPPLRFEHERIAVRVVVLDARARLNINTAGAAELDRLFRALGFAAADAAELARALLAARARARADGWPPARLPQPPREPLLAPDGARSEGAAPFQLVEEVRPLPGMSAGAYARAARHLTTAGDGRVNVNSAAMPVLLSLPGMDSTSARAITERRRHAPFSNVFELLGSLPHDARQRIQRDIGGWTDRVAFGPRTVEIVVDAVPATAPVRVRLYAEALLAGGSAVSLSRVIER